MLTREEKIDAINEVIARKDLTFGCRAKIFYTNYPTLTDKDFWVDTQNIDVTILSELFLNDEEKIDIKFYKDTFLMEDWILEPVLYQSYRNFFIKIIGHPVIIGDIMDYFYGISYKLPYDDFSELINSLIKDYKYELRLPIEEQSDKCVDFIYNLISEQWEK